MTKRLSSTRVVAVDLDGLLIRHDVHRSIYELGDPFPGAKEFLQKLTDMGYYIIIHCARINSHTQTGPKASEKYDLERVVKTIKEYLRRHRWCYGEVWTGRGKPVADAYFDDKAVPCKPAYDPDAFERALEHFQAMRAEFVEPVDARPLPLSEWLSSFRVEGPVGYRSIALPQLTPGAEGMCVQAFDEEKESFLVSHNIAVKRWWHRTALYRVLKAYYDVPGHYISCLLDSIADIVPSRSKDNSRYPDLETETGAIL